MAESGSLPRVPGIEAAGTVESAQGGKYAAKIQVMTMMGGMGRSFDGDYAEHGVVAAAQVIPFCSDLGWGLLGAVYEMRMGMTVLSTTRRPKGRALLECVGVDHPLIDDGDVAAHVAAIGLGGVDSAVELVYVDVLKDTLRALRSGGTACFTGVLSDRWTIRGFSPMDWLPNGGRLTAYSGEAADLPADVLRDDLDDVAAGRAVIPSARCTGSRASSRRTATWKPAASEARASS